MGTKNAELVEPLAPLVAALEAVLAKMNTPAGAIDEEKHQADKERRLKEHEAKRDVLLACLDPAVAAEYEAKKDHWRWAVEATVPVPRLNAKGKHSGTKQKIEKKSGIVAQNEQDAWAKFCDSVNNWPSPRDAKPKFTRGDKVPFEKVMTMQMTPSAYDANY